MNRLHSAPRDNRRHTRRRTGPNGLLNNLAGYWPGNEVSGQALDLHTGAYHLGDFNTVTSAQGLVYALARQYSTSDWEYHGRLIDDAALSAGDVDFTLASFCRFDTLLENRGIASKYVNAGQREYGIGYSTAVDNPSDTTLAALFEAVDADPNPNVRLAAVDALYLFRDRPGVRERLVRSLSVQTYPLVQVALIDYLVEVREARAAEALKKLVESGDLTPEVKKRAEQGLQQIA